MSKSKKDKKKPKYNHCDICFKENKSPGKNKLEYLYKKDDSTKKAVIDICDECAEVLERIKGN